MYSLNASKVLTSLFQLFFTISLFAAPSIERVFLRTALSPRVKDYSWSELRATFKNPDPIERHLTLRLVSEDSFFAVKKTIFEYSVTIPPSCELDYTSEAMAEGAESFRTELYEKGNRIAVSDNFLVSRVQAGRHKKFIAVLSDDNDLSLGSVNQLPEYKENLYQTFISANYCPSHYSLFTSYDCVIIYRPDFSKYSERQIKAISDYVLSGGKLVFADPQWVLAALSTPLSNLLPTKPIYVRKVNKSKSLKGLFPNFNEWSESEKYVDFLDSIPNEKTKILLNEGDSPLFCIKKYGAGTVFFSAVPLTEDTFKNSGIWPEIVKLAYINDLSNESSTATIELLDSLTGFSIPSPSEIRNQLLIVLLPTLTVIAIGILLRRGDFAWGILALLAVFMTWRIFKISSDHSTQTSQILTASADIVFCSPYDSTVKGRYSFFSKKDSSIDVKAISDNSLFSGIPPEANFILSSMNVNLGDPGQAGFKTISEPVESKKIDGFAKIANLMIKSNASRQFQQLASFYSSPLYCEGKISYSDDGMLFDSTNLPQFKEKIESAAIVFPTGVASLKIEDNKILGAKVVLDTIFNPTTYSLHKELPLRYPFLALVFKKKHSDYLPSLDNTSGHNVKIFVLPLNENFENNDKIHVPFELTNIMPADNSTRTFIRNCRTFSIMTQDDSEYRFKFRVPDYFLFAKPDKIEVKLDYVSDYENVEVIPSLCSTQLLQANQKSIQNVSTNYSPQQMNQSKIRFKDREKNIFIFSGDEINDIIDPSGSAVVILDIRTKKKDLPLGQKLRENRWTMKDFKVALTGKKRLIPNNKIY